MGIVTKRYFEDFYFVYDKVSLSFEPNALNWWPFQLLLLLLLLLLLILIIITITIIIIDTVTNLFHEIIKVVICQNLPILKMLWHSSTLRKIIDEMPTNNSSCFI